MNKSIPDRFEEQVCRFRDQIAVETKTHTITYDRLNRMANAVAIAVLTQKGGSDEPVAVLLESSAPMVAALLGVFITRLWMRRSEEAKEFMANVKKYSAAGKVKRT